jgi:hypothetical protein
VAVQGGLAHFQRTTQRARVEVIQELAATDVFYIKVSVSAGLDGGPTSINKFEIWLM